MRFVTVPTRALAEREPPPIDRLAADLFTEPGPRLAPIEAWSLPFLVDGMLGRYPDFPYVLEIGPWIPSAGAARANSRSTSPTLGSSRSNRRRSAVDRLPRS
jgi:hypothetical protein